MAHYAFLNDDNIVTEVIVGRHEWEQVGGITDWESYYGNVRGQRCVRTSYNTRYVYEYEYDDSEPPKVVSATIVGSEHAGGGTPFRGCYAGIGYWYDEAEDVFVPPATVDDDAN